MSLSPAELLFIEKRERLTRQWPTFGFCLLFLFAGIVFWLWNEAPHMVDPWLVAASLEDGVLPESTMIAMAAMLPIVVLILIAAAGIFVLLGSVTCSNEYKLIQVLRRECADSVNSEPPL
ncbi:MAG: hypothetical protein ACI9DC_000118 [Gammaproteobacteria bacterium]|jgi:hypothetical protein